MAKLLPIVALVLWWAYCYASVPPVQFTRPSAIMGAPCTTTTDIQELGNGSLDRCLRVMAGLDKVKIGRHK